MISKEKKDKRIERKYYARSNAKVICHKKKYEKTIKTQKESVAT